MRAKHFLWVGALIGATLLGDASQPHAAAVRQNALQAAGVAQATVDAILLGPEFSIFYGGFEN